MTGAFEKNIQKSMFSKNSEKTSIDKLLARNEVERINEIIKREKLGREGTLELLYLCLGTESKLLNLGQWERYVLLKFFVWIREFTKLVEMLYDLRTFFKTNNMNISERCIQFLDNTERLMENNVKFLVDLYLNIGRTTLSLGGTAFMELLKNKFEMLYNQMGQIATNLDNNQGGKVSGLFRGKGK